ncbi:MAG: hypothetical protein IH577_01620 [Deltaproteobacteria bacterium]|nr:hypothetical protein [Deltaproteobacteria bacterium]
MQTVREGEAGASGVYLRQSLLHEAVRLLRRPEKQYMREQLRRAGTPGPKTIGIDEVSIRKGHTYRIAMMDMWKPFLKSTKKSTHSITR